MADPQPDAPKFVPKTPQHPYKCYAYFEGVKGDHPAVFLKEDTVMASSQQAARKRFEASVLQEQPAEAAEFISFVCNAIV